MEAWFQISHSSICALQKIVPCTDFEQQATKQEEDYLFVYDYLPGAQTLEQYIQTNPIPTESDLWCFACQIVGALMACAKNKLVSLKGLLHASKICIMPGKKHILLTGGGMNELLPAQDEQQALALLLLQLCSKSINVDMKQMDTVLNAGKFSTEWIEFVKQAATLKSSNACHELLPALAPHMMEQLNQLQLYVILKLLMASQTDQLELELAKELDNGRLFRLLAKINFVLEKPEYDTSR